jgi:hypothetical protein
MISCILDAIEKHPGLAAWVQAIGSIAAIVAAIVIAQIQKAEANRILARQEASKQFADEKNAHILARRLASILIEIEIQIQDSQKLLAKLPSLSVPWDERYLSYVLHIVLFRAAWDEAIFSRFDLLPTGAADVTAHLLYSTLVYNSYATQVLKLLSEGQGDGSKTRDVLAERLRRITVDLEKSKALLGPLVTEDFP